MKSRVKTVLTAAALLSAGIYACKTSSQSKVKDDTPAGSAADAAAATVPGTFADTWAHVKDGPYDALPQHQTGVKTFYQGATNLLSVATVRTLATHDDILPRFQKLVHPIGICYSGTWTIDRDSRNGQGQGYTGYFANNAKGLIIVRASEAMGNPNVGDWRAFGFAGKIFPTTDPNDQTAKGTANFFTVDDLGGTHAKSFLDLPKTNEPAVSKHLNDLLIFPTLAVILKTFTFTDSNPGIRQLYEIAELGHMGGPAVTPHWMSIRSDVTDRVQATDYRDEMRLTNYPNGLSFGIFISDVKNVWDRIGTIALTEDALADGCDHELHFHHPPFRANN